MGVFDRILGRDPSSRLDKAREKLNDDPLAAVELVRKIASSGEEPWKGRALELQRQAVELRLVEIRSKAGRSEAEGHLQDAAEWLRFGLDLPLDDSTREELESRIRDLERRADVEAIEELERHRALPPEVDHGLPDDREQAFEVLVRMLDDDVVDRYLEAGEDEAFRDAFLALHEGEAAEALGKLDDLVEGRPKQPVYRFERARARLVQDDPAGAREDLEAVWERFGDEPLDLAQTLSVPGLWAEAMLELEEIAPMLERLDGVADPQYGDPGLCVRFARGLVEAKRPEEAEDFLEGCRAAFSGEPTFPYLLAGVRKERGKRDEAIGVLETAIAPSCASGRCGAPSKHLPSFRLLARLHLDAGEPENLERVGDLMNHLAHAQDGTLPAEDLQLLAAYHRAEGRLEAAEEAEREAAALGSPETAGATASSRG